MKFSLVVLLVVTLSDEVHPAVGIAAILPWSASLEVSDPQKLQALSCLDTMATQGTLWSTTANRLSWAAILTVVLSTSSPVFSHLNMNITWQTLPTSLKREVIDQTLLMSWEIACDLNWKKYRK